MNRIIILLIFIYVTSCVGIGGEKTTHKETKSPKGPPTFVLTELNGRKLEENAVFVMNYDNTMELKLADGSVFRYVPKQHFGDDPLCNILANDNKGRRTAICIKPQSGLNVIIMLENDEMISNFKGFKI